MPEQKKPRENCAASASRGVSTAASGNSEVERLCPPAVAKQRRAVAAAASDNCSAEVRKKPVKRDKIRVIDQPEDFPLLPAGSFSPAIVFMIGDDDGLAERVAADAASWIDGRGLPASGANPARLEDWPSNRAAASETKPLTAGAGSAASNKAKQSAGVKPGKRQWVH